MKKLSSQVEVEKMAKNNKSNQLRIPKHTDTS